MSESVKELIQSLHDKYPGYIVTVCDLDEWECLNFTLPNEEILECESGSLKEQVLESDVFGWKIYDDKEIYIISEIEI